MPMTLLSAPFRFKKQVSNTRVAPGSTQRVCENLPVTCLHVVCFGFFFLENIGLCSLWTVPGPQVRTTADAEAALGPGHRCHLCVLLDILVMNR